MQTYLESLQKLFPDWEVRGIAPDWAERWLADGSRPELNAYLESCDLYVGEPLDGRRLGAALNRNADKIIIPVLYFRGLHPDIAVVPGFRGPLSVGSPITQCSLVALAARSLGMSVADAETIFHAGVYDALGYFDLYASEKARLLALFSAHGIDISEEFPEWEKMGDFFYITHHPRVKVLIDILRRALAGRYLDAAAFRASAALGQTHPDNLGGSEIWPIYPEIAAPLGFSGSMTWTRPSKPVVRLSLHEFVEGTFSALDYMHENWRSMPFVKRAANIVQDYLLHHAGATTAASPSGPPLDLLRDLTGTEKESVEAALASPFDTRILVVAMSALVRAGKFHELDLLYAAAPKAVQYDQGVMSTWCLAARLSEDKAEALRRAEEFVRLYPDEGTSYTNLIFALYSNKGYEYAISRADAWMARFRNEKEVVWPSADIAFLAGQWQANERLCRTLYVIQGGKLNDASWRQLVLSLTNQGKRQEAASALREALQAHPDSDMIKALSLAQYNTRAEPGELADSARSAESQRDWPEALLRWTSLVEHFPDLPAGYAGQAGALRQLNRPEEARSVLTAGLVRLPSSGPLLHELGRLLEQLRDWKEAEQCWRKLLALDDPPWAHALLAAALREQGRLDEAETVLIAAQGRFDDNPTVFMDYARLAELRRDWPEALVRWATVRERFPDIADGYARHAGILRQLGQSDEAFAELMNAVGRLPANGPLLHDLGRLSEQLRNWAKAEWCWRTLLALDDPPWAPRLLATALREQGRLSEAEDVLLTAQNRGGRDPAAFMDFARLAEVRRDWPEALQRWVKVREQFPDSAEGCGGVARVLRQLGRSGEAHAELVAGLERFPGSGPLLHDLGRLSEQRRDWVEAERCWRKLLALDDPPWAHMLLATALREQGRLDESDAVLITAQERLSNEPAVFADYARLAEARRDWPEALLRWARVRERFPDSAAGYGGHAGALRQTGHLREAHAELVEAVARFPENGPLLHDLGRLSEQTGDWSEAERCWRKLLALENPNWAHALLATALREQGRRDDADAVLDKAEDSLNKILQRSPEEPAISMDYARLAEARQDWPAALARWAAVRERFPDLATGHICHAGALRQMGRLDEAHAELVAAAACFPAEAGVWQDLGQLSQQLRDWPEAERCWRALLALDDRPARFHAALAGAILERGEPDRAIEVLQTALLRDPVSTEIRLSLLKVLDGVARTPEAMQALEDLLSAGCDEPALIDFYCQLTARSGDIEWGRRNWPRIQKIGAERGPSRKGGYGNIHAQCALLYASLSDRSGADFLLEWMLSPGATDSNLKKEQLVSILLHCYLTAQQRITWERLSALEINLVSSLTSDLQIIFKLLRHEKLDRRAYVEFILQIAANADPEYFPSQLLLACNKHILSDENRSYLHSFFLSDGDSLARAVHSLKPVGRYILLIAAEAAGADALERLVAVLQQQGDPSAAELSPATVDGVLQHILKAYRVDPAVSSEDRFPAPAIASRSRKINVCLCVSGQLRGYREAVATWETLGWEGVNLTTVVHTWKHIGRNLPNGLNTVHRNFDGAFSDAYRSALQTYGWDRVVRLYPALASLIIASGPVAEQELQDTFKTKHLIIEDDTSGSFRDKSNFYKMGYKILACHKLARRVLPDADVYIRIRPDRDYSTATPIDWDLLSAKSRAYRRIFVDKPRMLTYPYHIGDQFAAGGAEAMDEYAASFDRIESAMRGELWSYCRVHNAHESLAFATLNAGVSVRMLHELGKQDRFFNPSLFRAADVLGAVQIDIASRPPISHDEEFVAALMLDVGGESVGGRTLSA